MSSIDNKWIHLLLILIYSLLIISYRNESAVIETIKYGKENHEYKMLEAEIL